MVSTRLSFFYLSSHHRSNEARNDGNQTDKRTNADDIELEATLQEFPLDLRGDAVKTDVALRVDRCCGHGRHFVERCKVRMEELRG